MIKLSVLANMMLCNRIFPEIEFYSFMSLYIWDWLYTSFLSGTGYGDAWDLAKKTDLVGVHTVPTVEARMDIIFIFLLFSSQQRSVSSTLQYYNNEHYIVSK